MFSTGRHAKKRLDIVSFAIASIFALLLAPLVVPNFEQPAKASGVDVDQALTLPDTADGSATSYDGVRSAGVIPATGDFTAEAWVYPESLNNVNVWHAILQQSDESTNSGRFDLNIHTIGNSSTDGFGHIQVIYDGNNIHDRNLYPGTRVNEGEWTHIAVSVDVINQSNDVDISIYVNGALVAEKSVDPVDGELEQGNFAVGYFPFVYGTDRHFHGKIDQVKIWNGALDAEDVVKSMHSYGDSSTTHDLEAHLSFNGDYVDETENHTFTNVGSVSLSNVAQTNTVDGDTVITFPRTYLSSDGGWTPPVDGAAWEALMVAGGGAGGVRHGGGGGAGELLYTSNITFTGATEIQVGQGGVATESNANPGNNGQQTTLGTNRVSGGGAGSSSGAVALSGGSGGGGASSALGGASSVPKETLATGETGIGNSGGNGFNSTYYQGGGGGGAGSSGGDATDGEAGDGGAGYEMNISGGVICYSAGGGGGAVTGQTIGAGGSCENASTTAGSGGIGNTGPAGSGGVNTGSGGGGGGFGDTANSPAGSGGSGVVILRTAPVATVSVASSSLPNTNNDVDVTLSAKRPRSGYTYQVTLEVTAGDGKLTLGSTGTSAVSNDANTDYAFGFAGVTTVETLRLVGSLDTIRTAFDDVTFNMSNSTTDNTLRIEIVEVPDDITTASNSGTVYYNDGRFYEFVSGVDDYSTATAGSADLNSREAAKSRFVFNQPGYLANITSETENDFTADRIDASNVRFGAYNANTSGTWRWLDGPEEDQQFSIGATPVGGAYVSWASGEPNNSAEYAVTNYTGTKGLWDDNAKDAGGYLAEFGVNTGSSAGREFVRLFQTSTQTVGLVAPTPVINTQPADTTAVDREATFTVSASSSSGTLSYQWQESTDGSTFTNISNSSGSFDDSSGDAHYSGATTNTLTIQGVDFDQNGYDYRVVVINSLGGDTTPVTSDPAELTFNRSTASPTLSYSDVTFSDGGAHSPSTQNNDVHDGAPTFSSSPDNVCEVDDSSSSAVSMRSAGNCTVTASYPSTSKYSSTTVSDSFTISKANQAALNWDLDATKVDYGSTLDLAVTGGSGRGAVTYTPSGGGCSISGDTLIALDASDSCSVTATKASDDSYESADTSSQNIEINKIAQPSELSMTSSSTMTVPETLELTGFGGDGDGALSFQEHSDTDNICSISGNQITATAAGACQVKVTRAAGTNHQVKTSSPQTITISEASQTISFTSSVPSDPEALDTYTPIATSTSGLTVSFSIDRGSSSVCSISDGVVTFNAGGSCVIEADQSGDTSYSAANTVSQTIVVGKTNQNITFGSLSNKTWGTAAFQVSATASSSLDVTYSADSSTTNSACSVSSTGLVTLENVGTCVVKVSQAGNSTFAAANDVLQSFEVVADTPGAPFIGSVSFGDRSLTASFFKPTYLGGGTLSGYQLVAYEAQETGGVVSAGSVIATNDACRPSGTSNESCTITGLTNGSDVVLRVAAINQSGVGDQSAISQKRTPASNPEAPQNLVAVQGDGTLDLSWDQPTGLGGGTFVEYKLFWREAGGSYNAFANENHSIASIATTSYTITGLDNGTSYDVKILVTTSVNNAELESNTAEVVQTPYTVPDAPGSVVVIEDGARVIVSWTVPGFDGGNAIDGYNVKIDSTLECTLVTSNSCEITKPDAGSSVTISVEAENDAGPSAAATASFSVPGTPPGPSQPGSGGFGPTGGGTNPDDDGQSKIGFKPSPPSKPAAETGPTGTVEGSSEEVSFGADDSNESLTASGRGWQVSVSAQSVIGDAIPVREDKSLSFPIASVAVFEGSGLKPNSVLEAWVFSEETYLGTIDIDQSGNLIGNIQLPETLLPGEHTLQLGTETSAGRLIVLTMPITVEGKVTVGTFKGYIAIYTKDLEGQRLSARVAGKWLVQDPIDTFKDFGYSRVVRFTGAGYDILVDVYINRQFFERTTTRTR